MGSNTFNLQGRLLVDCLNVNKPLVENVTLGIKLYPNPPNKCIVSATNLRTAVELHDIHLLVPRIVPKVSLLKQPASYPWANTRVHRFMFPAGSRTFGPRIITTTDILPRRCIVVLMRETQLNGQADQNRQELRHYDVEQMLVTVNNTHKPFYGGYTAMFDDADYGFLYDNLFRELGDTNTIDITREDFTGGVCVFPFNLTDSNVSSSYYPVKKSGSVDLQISFRIAPPQNLSILVLLEEERVYKIDKNREFTDKIAQGGG